MVSGADYQTKFVTTMAGDDLPDIMHICYGYALAPNLPAFFKAKCADLTPYLAGDAAKDYPYLAAIPTYAWKNSVSAIDGALYLIPIQRHLPIFPGLRRLLLQQHRHLGQGDRREATCRRTPTTSSASWCQLTRPQENRWGIGNPASATSPARAGRSVWRPTPRCSGRRTTGSSTATGKLIRDRETEEYKAAVGFLRDLMAGGRLPAGRRHDHPVPRRLHGQDVRGRRRRLRQLLDRLLAARPAQYRQPRSTCSSRSRPPTAASRRPS